MTEFLDALRAQLGAAYHLERELGGGGMSRVFLAEERALGRRVVLKVLPPELASVLSAARFEREVRVAARLQHPHIVPLLAAGQAGEVLYYTMPLVDGESLRGRLDRERELPVADAARLLRELADALAYAHAQGVVHRDIKPENVLLSHGHAMITDFGVARAVWAAVADGDGTGRLTHTGMAVGTPAYMAPEQAMADPQVDHRADLYALGVLGYEALAGEPPFRGASAQALVAAQITQTPTPLAVARPTVPPELAALVHRCLEKRPADRFAAATEVVAALERLAPALARGVPPATTQPMPAAGAVPAPAAISRRAALASGAAMGLAGLALGGGIRELAPEAAAPLPSYQRLTFRRGLVRTARFGPDGRTILYGALWEGDDCRTYAVRPESPESAPLPLPVGAPLAVSSLGEVALALGTHRRGIMTYGTLARVPLAGGAPRELREAVKYADWSPDGRELAIVRRDGAVDLLEYPVGTAVARPGAPEGGFSFVRVAPDGERVAAFELTFRDWLVGRLVIVDRRGGRRATTREFFNVFGLAWHGDEVWFTAADALPLFRNTVYAMGGDGRVRIVARMPGNTSLHDIAPDGRILLARTDDRSGLAVRAPGDADERDLSWLDASTIADISRDGRRILFGESGVGGGPRESAYLRPLDGAPAVRLGDGTPYALSPDGAWALVRSTREAEHLDVLPTGAGTSKRLARPGLRLLDARWLADGGRVLVRAATKDGIARLYVLDVDGAATVAVTPDEPVPGDARWVPSPAGDRVAFSTGARLALLPLDGSRSAARVPGAWDRWHAVGWITGGLLLSESPRDGGEVWRVDPQTGAGSRWHDFQPRDPSGIMNLDLGTLETTPDGRGYAYTWHRALSDLYLVTGWT